MNFIIQNITAVTETALLPNTSVTVKDGKIASVGRIAPEDASLPVLDGHGGYLTPGLIDTHSHGGGGFDVMDGTKADIIGAAQSHLYHGTTTYLPTSMTCPDAELFTFIENFKAVKADSQTLLPHLPGMHLEGPYFSPAQCGGQPKEYLSTPTIPHFTEILNRSEGLIARWSSAPELPGALDLGDECAARGILCSIGHSDADFDQVKAALSHGYTHITHLYSCMSTITRRKGFRVLGIIECAYLFDELHVELIADGKHLPPELLRLVLKEKPHDKITLITDSMRGAGMPDGPSVCGSRTHGTPCIIGDGIAHLTDYSAFAGSVATADRLLRTMVNLVGLDLVDAVNMATIRPARLLHLDKTTGSIEVGKDADLLLLTPDLTPVQVWVSGTPAL